MSNYARFWNRIADKYASKPVPDETVYKTKLRKTREYLKPDMELLELGCGTGSTAIIHAPYVRHILATDFSEKMISIAKEKAHLQGIENVTFKNLDSENASFENNSFDVILALSLLHLLPEKQRLIQSVYDWLKPGGIFVTSTVCIGDTLPLIKYIAPLGQWLGLMPKINCFGKTNLLDDHLKAGFGIEHQWSPNDKGTIFVIAKKPVS